VNHDDSGGETLICAPTCRIRPIATMNAKRRSIAMKCTNHVVARSTITPLAAERINCCRREAASFSGRANAVRPHACGVGLRFLPRRAQLRGRHARFAALATHMAAPRQLLRGMADARAIRMRGRAVLTHFPP
jgi:hypothetical protein